MPGLSGGPLLLLGGGGSVPSSGGGGGPVLVRVSGRTLMMMQGGRAAPQPQRVRVSAGTLLAMQAGSTRRTSVRVRVAARTLMLMQRGGPAVDRIVIPTNLGVILLAVQSAIVSSGLFPRRRCAITLTPTPLPTAGGPQVLIIPGKQHVDQENLAGGGRYTNVVDAEFELHLIHRAALDHAQQDSRRLTDAATGIMGLATRLADVLLLTWPSDPAGNLLTIEPIRDDGPGVTRSYGDSFEWSGTPNFWRVKFLRAVTQRV